MSLMKTTKVTERVSVEFGVQAFNIFNHVQLGDPNTNNLAFNYVQVGSAWVLQPAGESRSDHDDKQFQQQQRQRHFAKHGDWPATAACNSCFASCFKEERFSQA